MAKSKSMDRVRNAFWGAQQKETDVIPGVGNVAKKHSSKKAVFKTIAIIMILQGIAGYCFWVYTAYNDVIEHIENPPVITEYKTIEVEKQVEVEKKSEQEQEVSEAYATGGKETHQDTIRRVAKAAGFQDPELLIAIAECESGSRKAHTIRPDVPNTKSTAVGAFQYLKGTWEEGVKKTGNDWSLDDRKDLEKATRMAIWHIHGGFLKKWDASKHCWNK